ncbi:pathogenicity protein [Metarhizium album ARSEF 1941]|uniref:Protein YOP1 n=1 Tax=Metarhizium album (strain ARSEF 1941) TaxID=1081103 RepID=A0A0B2X763_METAS|nr:pathogenicity protein [Metarhizium album ARSEF 1941]KHO01608.1 pathogenicity protein [Metarhizium album ARSEF 1941]
MFDLFAMLLSPPLAKPPALVLLSHMRRQASRADPVVPRNSSVASFLFPIFASYKALKTSDPAQLTPWLMYWVVFSICLLVESWLSFILFWIPFYGYFRLLFFLYLILPQTQGARLLYEEHVHPFLANNETSIDEFIASAHKRLKATGMTYLRRVIEYLKTNVLNLPASEPEPAPSQSPAGPQGYTQSLLARFSVPRTRWAGTANTGNEFYNLLASAVSAASQAGGFAGNPSGPSGTSMTDSGTLIPPHVRGSAEKMTFIAAQRERLNIVLSALDREAQQIQSDGAGTSRTVPPGSFAPSGTRDMDDDQMTHRPPSGLGMSSALSKSRSETDFEKVEAESGAEDEVTVRRRNVPSGSAGSSWMPWGWGGAGEASPGPGGPKEYQRRRV